MTHISNAALEALAAGETVEPRDQEHIQSCAACRETFNAMRVENQLFAAELSAASELEGVPMTPSIALARFPAAQRHKPFVIYAAAASVMLIAALGIIASMQTPVIPPEKPTSIQQTVAANGQKPKPQNSNADEKQPPTAGSVDPVPPPRLPDVHQNAIHENTNPTKGDPVPPPPPPPTPTPTVTAPVSPQAAQELVYEGKTTMEWLAILHQDGSSKELREKAVHALVQMGRDGLPQIIAFLGKNGSNDLVAPILNQIEVRREDLSQFATLLKEPNYAVRKAGVQLLANLADHQLELQTAVIELLNNTLQDRDKAVVEAARAVYDRLAPAAALQKIQVFLNAGQIDGARKSLAEWREKLRDADYKGFELVITRYDVRAIEHDVTEKIQNGRIDQAMSKATDARKQYPNDDTIRRLYEGCKRQVELSAARAALVARARAAQEKLNAMRSVSTDPAELAKQTDEVARLLNEINKLDPTKKRGTGAVGEGSIDD